jgi:hypothetical protein
MFRGFVVAPIGVVLDPPRPTTVYVGYLLLQDLLGGRQRGCTSRATWLHARC